MEKPASLRKLLERVVPQIAADPSKLDMFTDGGRIAARQGSLSFELRYTLSLVLQSFSGDPNDLFVPILAWIAEFQPELMGKPDAEPFGFRAEILDDDSADVEITIALTERVRVTPKDGGGWISTILPEPTLLGGGFMGACDAKLWQLFLHDDVAGTEELIAQTSDPAFQPAAA